MGKLSKHNTIAHVGTKSNIMKSDFLPKSKPNRKFQLALMGLSQTTTTTTATTTTFKQKRPDSRSSSVSRTNVSLSYTERSSNTLDSNIQFSSRCHSNLQQISFTRSSPKPSPPDTPGKSLSELSDLSSLHRPYKASPLSQLNDSNNNSPISFVRSKHNNSNNQESVVVSSTSTLEPERVIPVSKVKSGICMRSINRLNDQLGKSLTQSLLKSDAPHPPSFKEATHRSSPVVALKESTVSRSSSSVSEAVTPHSIVSPLKGTLPSIVGDILRSQAHSNLNSADKSSKKSILEQGEPKKPSQSSRVNCDKPVVSSPQQPVSVFLRLGKGKRPLSRSPSPELRSDHKRGKTVAPLAPVMKRNSLPKNCGSKPIVSKANRFDSFENWDNFRSNKFNFYSDLPVPKLQSSYESTGISSSSSFDSRFPSPGYVSQSSTNFSSGGLYPPMFNGGYPIVRCAYFPHCSRPDCTFFHPEEECHYGDSCPYFKECVYVHPSELVPTMCKYDDTCTRMDCFYHHVKRRHTVGKPDTFIPINCLTEGCVEPQCPYVHPGQKLPFAQDYCIFQARCNRPPCLRVHISEFRFKPPRKVLYTEDISKEYLGMFSTEQQLKAEPTQSSRTSS